MQTSTDLSQSIRTLTLDDFGITNKTSQRMSNTFKGKTLPVNQSPPTKQQVKSQLKWNRLYAKSNFGSVIKNHILSPQSIVQLENIKPNTVSYNRPRQHLRNSIVSISQKGFSNPVNQMEKFSILQDQTPQPTKDKEPQVEDIYQMQTDLPDVKQCDSFKQQFVTQFTEQLGLKHCRTADDDYKLSSYITRNVVMPPKRKATSLKQFLEQQTNILDDMKNEQELAYQNKQREQQLTRLVTQWEELNGRKLQSRLDEMGFPKRIDFEKINALKMRATAKKGKPTPKARIL